MSKSNFWSHSTYWLLKMLLSNYNGPLIKRFQPYIKESFLQCNEESLQNNIRSNKCIQCLQQNYYSVEVEYLSKLHFERPECIPCNSNFSLKHVLIDCVNVADLRQTFYNTNSLSNLFTNVAGHTILQFS
jgi:hypothetical protein